MKMLLILSFAAILIGAHSKSLRWPQIAMLAAVVLTVAGWQTANILFRYIGVE